MPSTVDQTIQDLAQTPAIAPYYAGEQDNPDGSVTAYMTAGGASLLTEALAATTMAPKVPYTVKTVSNTLIQLQNLTAQIDNDQASLAAQGVTLSQWGPDIASNTVKVQLDNYSQAAASTVTSTFGAQNVTVVPDPDPGLVLQPDADRNNPTPPWYGGIPLFYRNNKSDLCTLGFSFVGNNSGDTYSDTAGHCGVDGLWGTGYNNNLIFGYTSTNYWEDTAESTDDIQSLTSSQGFEPVVYVHQTTTPTTRNVIGYRDLQTGTITFDGFTTGGEKPGWTIDSYDQCIAGKHFDDGYNRCHISEASNPNAKACYVGDSGGPVYQRNGADNVYAVGLIIAGDPPQNYHHCYYYTIGAFRTLVDGKIQTVSGTGG